MVPVAAAALLAEVRRPHAVVLDPGDDPVGDLVHDRVTARRAVRRLLGGDVLAEVRRRVGHRVRTLGRWPYERLGSHR